MQDPPSPAHGGKEEKKKVPAGKAPPKAPTFPGGTLFRPSFDVEGEELEAGYAFAVEVGKARKTMIVTAMEPFGELVNQVKPPPWKTLPEKVKGYTLLDAVSFEPAGSGGAPLTLVKAWPASAPGPLFIDAAGDTVAFFPPEGYGGGALRLADPGPGKGASVWLVLAGGDGTLRFLHGEVVESDGKVLKFALDEKADLTDTAGAPVVDGDGALAGIHIGIGFEYKGRFLGAACPVMMVRIHLLKGLDDLRKTDEEGK